MNEYDRTREAARELLRAGKTAEAEKLLNDRFEEQFARADALMTELARTPNRKKARQ